MRMLKAVSLLVLVLAGCSVEPTAPPATDTVAAPEAATPPAPAAQPPTLPIASGGRPDPVLANDTEPALQPPPVQPLSQADFEGRIDSGLGCSFESADGQTLLVATAPADAATRAEGVVKIAGRCSC